MKRVTYFNKMAGITIFGNHKIIIWFSKHMQFRSRQTIMNY